MIQSARQEYNFMVKNHHARTVSRMGFIGQEIMNFHDEVSRAIQDRRVQINNDDAVCIANAEGDLATSFEEAGNELTLASRDWYDEISLIDDEFITPLLDEMDIIKALLEIEVFGILGVYNFVDDSETVIITLALEAALWGALFELFVSEIYTDFVIFDTLTNQKNAQIFPMLDEGLNNFRAAGNLIRNSLANCNE